MFRLLTYLKPYKKESILGPFFKLLEALLEIMLPTIMALVINHGVAQRDSKYVLMMGGLMFLMSVLGFGSSMICQFYASRASQGFGTLLRNAMFGHILKLSHSELNSYGASSLINRVTNDVNQMQTAVAMTIRLVIRALCIFVGAIGMAMLLDFQLSLILVATVPFIAAILYFFVKTTSPLYKLYQKKLDALANVIGENLSGVRVIRAFAAKRQERGRFAAANEEQTQTGIRIGFLSALLNPMTQLVINVGILLILWLGGYQTHDGKMQAGTIIAFVNYMTQIVYALTVASNMIVLLTKASTSAGRINEILEIQPSIANTTEEKAETAREKGTAEFRNVSFRYGNAENTTLTGIDLKVGKGETIGIIGGTGAGKTTLVQLLPRFFDASEGQVLVDGVDVREYELKELRSKFGIVPQKNELFSGTIAENLRWGNPNASGEDMICAAKIAQAHEFISELPQGYESLVSAGGINFSGGQRQRLAIARALMRQPEFLILDDSSSALDFATDAALRQAIRTACANTTVFLISQRASTLREADKIAVLSEGTLVGLGKHEELLKSCEVYREIYYSQTKEDGGATA